MINGFKNTEWTWYGGVLTVYTGKQRLDNKLDITVKL